MAAIFGYDVITLVKAELESSLNTNITAINTARSTSATLVQNFTTGWLTKKLPECFIKLGNSDVLDNEGELNNNILREVEVWEMQISVIQKSAKGREEFSLEMEIYEEAIKKTLHGFQASGNFSWMVATTTERFDNPFTKDNKTEKEILVNFIIRSQGG